MKKIYCDYCGDLIENYDNAKNLEHGFTTTYDICKTCREQKEAEKGALELEWGKRVAELHEKWNKKREENAIIKCPSCRSKTFSILSNGRYICRICETEWTK